MIHRLLISIGGIVFTASVLYADIITIDGIVKSVDVEKRTIRIESGAKERTFDVSSKAKIVIGEKDAGFEKLAVGQKVSLDYHDQLEVVVKIEGGRESIGKDAEETLLFDGKSLKGWTAQSGKKIRGWEVHDGELVLLGEKNTPPLMTVDRFDDFRLECEFRLGPKANTGIFLRGRYELQLLDDNAYPKFRPNQLCGAIYGQLAPSKSVYLGVNEWNTLVVTLKGKQITVVMNGEVVIDDRTLDGITSGAIDDQEDLPGPIILQSHTGSARFRNMKISDISDPKNN